MNAAIEAADQIVTENAIYATTVVVIAEAVKAGGKPLKKPTIKPAIIVALRKAFQKKIKPQIKRRIKAKINVSTANMIVDVGEVKKIIACLTMERIPFGKAPYSPAKDVVELLKSAKKSPSKHSSPE